MKSKIAQFLSRIPDDKKNHFIMGAIIMFILRLIIGGVNLLLGSPLQKYTVVWSSFLLTCIVAYLVELYDHFSGKGVADSIDGLFTILGAVPQLQIEIQT